MSARIDSRELLGFLADGRFHSGEELAQTLGVSRAAVWKRLKKLQVDTGLELDSVRGKGHRLREPLDLLSEQGIRAALNRETDEKLGNLAIHQSVDSTNTWLMEQASRGAASGSVCLTERQSGGRGRHGRTWVSPFGTNIYLSLLWRYDLAPVQLAGLSLACGVAVARGLSRVGVEGIGLKWPNDLLWQRRKLAGLLLEVGGEASGPSYVVAGIGINTRMPPTESNAIDQPWVDLSSIPGVEIDSRDQVSALLINELSAAMDQYAVDGLMPFVEEWSRYDLFLGETVELAIGPHRITGEYLGIGADGAIRLRTDEREASYSAGEVSLCRKQS